MPWSAWRHGVPLSAAALGLTLLGGCTDQPPTAPASIPTGTSRVYQDCDPNAIIGGCSSDPVDTHVAADITVRTTVTVTTSEPFADPVTGTDVTSFTETAPDIHLHADAGYTYAGAVTVQTQFTDGADPAHTTTPQTVAADLTADNLTEVNSASQQLTDASPPELVADSPLGLVGSTQNGDVTAGVLTDQVDTIPVSTSRSAPNSGPLFSRAPDGGPSFEGAIARAEHGGAQQTSLHGVPVTVEVTASGRLVVTDDGGAGSTPTLRAERSAAASGSATPAAGEATGKHVRTFARLDADDEGNSLDHHGKATQRRKQWVLAEDRSEVDEDNGTRTLHQTHVMTYTNVRWFRNRARDAARHAARPTADWIPLANAGSGGAAPSRAPAGEHGPLAAAAAPPTRLRVPSRGPNRIIVCDAECQAGYTPPPPPNYGIDPGCGREIMAQVNPASSYPAVNLLFQHGIWSNATTWCDMSGYLRGRFVVGNEVRHSLSNVASYEDQSAELVARFQQD